MNQGRSRGGCIYYIECGWVRLRERKVRVGVPSNYSQSIHTPAVNFKIGKHFFLVLIILIFREARKLGTISPKIVIKFVEQFLFKKFNGVIIINFKECPTLHHWTLQLVYSEQCSIVRYGQDCKMIHLEFIFDNKYLSLSTNFTNVL